MTQAYPLSWPAGWRRQPYRDAARFGDRKCGSDGTRSSAPVSVAVARERLQREVDLLDAKEVVLSSNLELRLDGNPRSNMPEPRDTGAALYFKLNGKDTVLACDKWNRVADNIVAIAKHIEAIRGMDRWGVGTVEQVFTGYQALPAPLAKSHWTAVLGLPADAGREVISARYRSLARDSGTDQKRLLDLNLARDEALSERTLA